MRSITATSFLLALSACSSIPVEYGSVALVPGDPDTAGYEGRSELIRVYFSSPLDLATIAASSGLTCHLVFPDLKDVQGWGDVHRDLTKPGWGEPLPHLPSYQPETFYYYAGIQLMQGPVGWSFADVRPTLVGREFSRAELTVFVPGMLWRGRTSNPIIIPQQDLVDLLPNKPQQPASAPRADDGGGATQTWANRVR